MEANPVKFHLRGYNFRAHGELEIMVYYISGLSYETH